MKGRRPVESRVQIGGFSLVEKKQLLNSESQSKEEPEGDQVGNLEGERWEAKS